MPTFIFEASDQGGAIIRGERDAMSVTAVIASLRREELIPIHIEQKGIVGEARGLSIFGSRRLTGLERIIFVRNLRTALRAGLTLLEALDAFIPDADSPALRNLLVRARHNLENGQPLSATFAAMPGVFPPIVVGMLRVGEETGRLEQSLGELNRYLTREYELARTVKSALVYPAILMGMAGTMMFAMLFFIVPNLKKLFSNLGADIAPFTQLLFSVSDAVRYNVVLDIAIVAVVVLGARAFMRSGTGRRFVSLASQRVPALRTVIMMLALVRFTRTMGGSIASGLSAMEAMSIASDTVGDERYRAAIVEAQARVREGAPLAQSLGRSPLFPHFLTSLLAVGERAGSFEEMFLTFADFYEEEAERALKTLMSILEIIILAVLGFIVAFVALSMLYPIYQFFGTLS